MSSLTQVIRDLAVAGKTDFGSVVVVNIAFERLNPETLYSEGEALPEEWASVYAHAHQLPPTQEGSLRKMAEQAVAKVLIVLPAK